MILRVGARFANRLPALLALGVPVLAGMGAMALLGAPFGHLLTNAAALVAGVVLLLLPLPVLASGRSGRLLVLFLLSLLFVPWIAGPDLAGVSRWIELGPITLHAGMLAIPALCVLGARDPDYAAPVFLAALLACLLQPDAASAFALTFAAVGIHHATRDWKMGVVAIAGFFAMLAAAVRGELPVVEYADRVLVQYAAANALLALGLFASLVGGFCLMALALPVERPARLALAGSLFGFSIMGVMANYPSPLIGYGAAAILGYGLALGLSTKAAT
ncbi:hypothetical protein [Alteraurantiacibacter palmitatis]|uniref:Cell wall polymerase n=1 Tax=Alteraurantiacibacter palmitatis TaxID=2054628 RepID=A0ABV7E4S2_9SPHN